jgi:hypothetical protein
MTKTLNRSTTTGMSVLIVIGLLFAWFGPTRAATASDTVITVFEAQGPYSKLVDVGKHGPSAGDFWVELHQAQDPNDGHEIGSIRNRLTVIKPVRANGEVADLEVIDETTIRLADGDITLYGSFLLSEIVDGVTVPVTGGTGAYELARGSATLAPAELGGVQGGTTTLNLTLTS